MIPQVMGYPLWCGRIKKRVAKKYLRLTFRDREFLSLMASIGEGDLVNDCRMANVRIKELAPQYVRRAGGYVLNDVLITDDKGSGCSLIHCGVKPGKSREEILERHEASNAYWAAHGDTWDFVKRSEFTTFGR
jgi:hypothetical protein